MVYLYNGSLFSSKKETVLSETTWMNEKRILLKEARPPSPPSKKRVDALGFFSHKLVKLSGKSILTESRLLEWGCGDGWEGENKEA